MMSEGVEQTPDGSQPRPPPERPPIVRWNPRRLAQKCEYHRKAHRRLLGILQRNDGFLSSTWNRSHFFSLRREILHGPLCKDDTYILFFFEEEEEEEQHGPCFDDTSRI